MQPFIIKYIVGCSAALLFSHCTPSGSAVGSTADETAEDSIEAHWQVQDTVILTQGTIPKDWTRVDLEKGYYVAFPEEPKERTYKEKKQIVHKLEKNNYSLVCTQTDLTADSSFQQNRHRIDHFYEAIFEDMASDLGSSIARQQNFTLLKLYPAARADFRSDTELISMQCMVIGNKLYTQTALLWKQDKTALLQIRDYFFAAFGKDLYVE